MDNLLNFKQKIVKRKKKSTSGSGAMIWNSKPINGHVSSYHKKSRSLFIINKKPKKTSFRRNNIILPKQLISRLKFKNEEKSIISASKKKKFKLKLKYIFTSGSAFLVLFGLILSSSISSTAVDPAESFIFQKDTSIEDSLKSEFLLNGEVQKNTEKIDLSILKGLNIVKYTVKEGDSLSKIAVNHHVSMGTIISFNKIKNAKKLYKGTVLSIPQSNGIMYEVRKGDSLSRIAGKYDVSFNRLLDMNNLESSLIRTGQKLFIPDAAISSFELKKTLGELFLYPVRGIITSPYGYRTDPFTGRQSMHYGIDIANRQGTAVKATLDGKVLKCGTSLVYGKYIIVKHPGGFQSLYAHLNKYLVRTGQNISQGQIIAELGNTGRSTGPHLHFSIYKNQKPVDPLKQLSGQ